ncbi:MAG TPA: hypothetical protein VLM76_02205 [Patescibacteria group bacterium]|nr:hypothetical protein [Patescibacteria group bacterium]
MSRRPHARPVRLSPGARLAWWALSRCPMALWERLPVRLTGWWIAHYPAMRRAR